MIKEYNQSQPLAFNICVYVYSTHSYTQAQACIHIQISWANALLTWLKKLYSSKLTTLYQISLAVRCLASLQYVVVSVRLDLFYPNDPFFPFVCAPVIQFSFPSSESALSLIFRDPTLRGPGVSHHYSQMARYSILFNKEVATCQYTYLYLILYFIP